MQSPDDLPEPAGLLAHEDGSGFVDCYTAEQMRAYRAEGVAQERERCAENLRKYQELLYAVSRKHIGETRHETALRYIRLIEQQCIDGPAKASSAGHTTY
jgi:hypothetical protein